MGLLRFSISSWFIFGKFYFSKNLSISSKIEREIKETIPFTIATERIKYSRIYLPKETKDLYIENYKTQRDGMGREEGGGFRMGNTCIPVADSF